MIPTVLLAALLSQSPLTLYLDGVRVIYMPPGPPGDVWSNLFVGPDTGTAWNPAEGGYGNSIIGPFAAPGLHGTSGATNPAHGNTLHGFHTGQSLQRARWSTISGTAAYSQCAEAWYVTAAGYHAMESYCGFDDIAGGVMALRRGKGWSNVVFGNDSLSGLSPSYWSYENVVSGAASVRDAQIAQGLVVQGFNSLDNCTNCTDVIAIGRKTGNGVLTGTGAILIGSNVVGPSAANQIVNIGDVFLGDRAQRSISLPLSVGGQPACGPDQQFRIWTTTASGVRDSVSVCVKSETDTWAWKPVVAW